jgi:hypothetical protein
MHVPSRSDIQVRTWLGKTRGSERPRTQLSWRQILWVPAERQRCTSSVGPISTTAPCSLRPAIQNHRDQKTKQCHVYNITSQERTNDEAGCNTVFGYLSTLFQALTGRKRRMGSGVMQRLVYVRNAELLNEIMELTHFNSNTCI